MPSPLISKFLPKLFHTNALAFCGLLATGPLSPVTASPSIPPAVETPPHTQISYLTWFGGQSYGEELGLPGTNYDCFSIARYLVTGSKFGLATTFICREYQGNDLKSAIRAETNAYVMCVKKGDFVECDHIYDSRDARVRMEDMLYTLQQHRLFNAQPFELRSTSRPAKPGTIRPSSQEAHP